jgi:hypothetical protein
VKKELERIWKELKTHEKPEPGNRGSNQAPSEHKSEERTCTVIVYVGSRLRAMALLITNAMAERGQQFRFKLVACATEIGLTKRKEPDLSLCRCQ